MRLIALAITSRAIAVTVSARATVELGVSIRPYTAGATPSNIPIAAVAVGAVHQQNRNRFFGL
jgi:hypothetical protein